MLVIFSCRDSILLLQKMVALGEVPLEESAEVRQVVSRGDDFPHRPAGIIGVVFSRGGRREGWEGREGWGGREGEGTFVHLAEVSSAASVEASSGDSAAVHASAVPRGEEARGPAEAHSGGVSDDAHAAEGADDAHGSGAATRRGEDGRVS